MKRVGDLLREFMNERGWSEGTPYDPLFHEWHRVTGDALSAHARLVDIQKGMLLVEVDHPGWLLMAQMRKAAILEAARTAAPRADIHGIRFRVGPGGGASR